MNSYTGTDTDTSMKCHTGTDIEKYKSKNAAKRSRQHAGKRYQEYAQCQIFSSSTHATYEIN